MVNIEELASQYWYVLVIAGLILFYFIWKKMDNSTRIKIRKLFSGKVLFVILFVGIWIVWHREGASEMVSDANRFMPMIFFIFLSGYYLMGKLRYESPQIVCPNFSGSFCKPPVRINGFLIFAIDSFNAGGLSWEYASRILILREETCELFPQGAVSIANVGYASKMDLDEDVKDFIEKNKFFRGSEKEIFYGWFDDLNRVDWEFEKLKELSELKRDKTALYNLIKKELGVDNPKISTLYWAYRNLSKAHNKRGDWYHSVVEDVETGVEHQQSVKKAYDIREKDYQKPEGNEEY